MPGNLCLEYWAQIHGHYYQRLSLTINTEVAVWGPVKFPE